MLANMFLKALGKLAKIVCQELLFILYAINDLPRGHMWPSHVAILPLISPDKDQSSIILVLRKMNETDKFKLNFEAVNVSMRKMLVSPDSRKMYKSFGT